MELFPPTIKTIFPIQAWAEDPEMGTSIHSIPFFDSLSPRALLSHGGDVLVSTTICPFRAPTATPSLPSTTSRTDSQVGRDNRMRSAPFAASLGEFTTLTPRGTKWDICLLMMSKPVTWYPAFISRV